MGMQLIGGMEIINGMQVLTSGGGGGSDPYFADVVLLVHGDGVNGGTTFTDSSSYGRSPSAASNITTSNEQTIFGQNTIKSINLAPDFGGSILQYASNSAFAITQSFTLEFQLYLPASFSQPYFMARSAVSYAAINQVNNALSFLNYPGNPGGTLTPNAWNYVAYSADATATNLYINGTRVETQGPGTPEPGDQPFNLVGTPGRTDLTALGGYLAEIRYTQGVGRYSGATIPLQTAPWPNS